MASDFAKSLANTKPMSDEEYPTWKWWDEDKQCLVIRPRLTEQDWVDYYEWKKNQQ